MHGDAQRRRCTGGASVALSSNNANVTVPASVTVAAGATTGAFTATVASVSTAQTATLTATLGGVSKTFVLTISPTLTVSSLSCNPASVVAPGTSACTVTLSAAAPRGRKRGAVQQQCQRHRSRERDRRGGSDHRRLHGHRGLSFDGADGNPHRDFGRLISDLRPDDFANADREQPEL